MRIVKAIPLLVGLAALSGCATPEHQLQAGLTNAGLPESTSACMAHEMTPQLSIGQLLKLRSLSRVGKLEPTQTSIQRFQHQVRALGDPEIIRVTGLAAIHCAGTLLR